MKTVEQKTITQKVTFKDVYELFQGVYEIASYGILSVYIDVESLTATIVMEDKSKLA